MIETLPPKVSKQCSIFTRRGTDFPNIPTLIPCTSQPESRDHFRSRILSPKTVSFFGPAGSQCHDHLTAKGHPVFLWCSLGVVQDAQLTIPSWLDINRLIAEPQLKAEYSSRYAGCCCRQREAKPQQCCDSTSSPKRDSPGESENCLVFPSVYQPCVC